MIYPIDWSSEDERHKLFVYQTRIGIAHKFGTLPIGWYQSHQCHAYDIIMEFMKAHKIESARARVIQGTLYIYPLKPKGKRILVTQYLNNIYKEADNRCRSGA